ncbi:MAG: S41 family peptidase [Porphyromonadaceae bacterium]|nr:S41 family peptidase [Porphyromonadaceae bacterium]
MYIGKILIGVVFLIFSIKCTYSKEIEEVWQTKALDTERVKNISALSKTYGYIRYFYPSDNLRKFDWYRFLILGLGKIETAATTEELKTRLYELFHPICPQIEFVESAERQKVSPPADRTLPFYVQTHTRDTHKSVNIRRFERYESGLPVVDSMYCFKLRDDLYVRFPIAVSKLPTNTKELQALKKQTKNIKLRLFDQSTIKILFGRNIKKEINFLKHYNARIADIIMKRNFIQHFYPYFYEDGLDTNWDKICEQTYRNAALSADVYQLYDAICTMMHNIKDSHTTVYTNMYILGSFFSSYLPQYYPDFAVNISQKTNGKGYAVSIADRDNAFVTKVNGIDVEQIVERKLNAISYSTLKHGIAMLNLNGELFKSFKKDSVIKLTVTENGSERNMDIETNKHFPKYTTLYPYYHSRDLVVPINDTVTYVNICNHSSSYKDFTKHLDLLSKSKVTILDLRGYPTMNTPTILSHYLDTAISLGKIQKQDFYYPDHKNVIYTDVPKWYIAPANSKESEAYSKKYEYRKPQAIKINTSLYILANETSISFAETLLDMLKHYKVGTIVGNYTAGCNGDVIQINMPFASFTTTGAYVVFRDGSRHHGVGIEPDIFIDSLDTDTPLHRLLKDIYYGKYTQAGN